MSTQPNKRNKQMNWSNVVVCCLRQLGNLSMSPSLAPPSLPPSLHAAAIGASSMHRSSGRARRRNYHFLLFLANANFSSFSAPCWGFCTLLLLLLLFFFKCAKSYTPCLEGNQHSTKSAITLKLKFPSRETAFFFALHQHLRGQIQLRYHHHESPRLLLLTPPPHL